MAVPAPTASTISTIKINTRVEDRPAKLVRSGYVAIRNPDNEQGYWTVDRRRQVVYAKATLTIPEQMVVAAALAERGVDTSM